MLRRSRAAAALASSAVPPAAPAAAASSLPSATCAAHVCLARRGLSFALARPLAPAMRALRQPADGLLAAAAARHADADGLAPQLQQLQQRRGKKYHVEFGTDKGGVIKHYGTMWEPKRAGLMGMKIGMMPMWDDYGGLHAATVVQVQGCFVTHVKTPEKDGYRAVQVGTWLSKEKHVPPAVRGQCARANVPLLRRFVEFPVSPEGVLPLGMELSARHFTPGQFVDVRAKSIGKGFQGVMKRHGFKGQRKSHGTSLAHRSGGSIGVTANSRVLPGTRMAGHMGNKWRTSQNMVVLRVDIERNLLYLKGPIPGNKGELVQVKDATKRPCQLWTGERFDRAFPTWTRPDDFDAAQAVQDAPKLPYNPLDRSMPARW